MEEVKNKIELLKEILAIKSVNGKDDEGKVAEYLCDYLQKCGVKAEVQRIDNKHGNLIAALPGATSENIIWNGHLDTVDYGDKNHWSQDPAIPYEKDGCIYARGASDMKSGLAAMAYTLGYMKRKNIVPKYSIQLLGTCDEEKNGLGAKKILEEGFMKPASLLLIGEPTDCQLGVAQKGCLWISLKVYGRTSHGAYPEEGVNAVEMGITVFERLKVYIEGFFHSKFKKSTVQITKIEGGIVPNMTPDFAHLVIDIRTVPGLTSAMILNKLDQINQGLTGLKDDLKFEVKVLNDRGAIEIEQNNPWIDKIKDANKKLNKEMKEIGINYFTDASIFTKKVKVPVLLFGPGKAHLAHKPDEYVEMSKYLTYIDILIETFS